MNAPIHTVATTYQWALGLSRTHVGLGFSWMATLITPFQQIHRAADPL
jgi:hypothetical protein